MEHKVVYVIEESKGKSYFTKVGVAFVNRDGSLNVKLTALPVNGQLHIRDYVPREGERAQSQQQQLEFPEGESGVSDDALKNTPF